MENKQILIGVCSREGTKNHQREEYSLMISLVDPELGTKGIIKPPKLQEHLLLCFHDLDDIEIRAPKYAGCKKPTHKHVEAILNSFRNLSRQQVESSLGALIHCEAGISRSTAAAIAGLWSLGLSPETAFNEIIKMNPLGLPNRRILRLTSEVLGTDQSILELAETQRRELFAQYGQEDPIQILKYSLEERNQILLALERMLKEIEIKLKGCKDAALEKTMERWRIKTQMSFQRKQRLMAQPKKESLHTIHAISTT